jgi:hypothetical protein
MAKMRSLENVGKKLLAAASGVVDYVRIDVRLRLQVKISVGELHKQDKGLFLDGLVLIVLTTKDP